MSDLRPLLASCFIFSLKLESNSSTGNTYKLQTLLVSQFHFVTNTSRDVLTTKTDETDTLYEEIYVKDKKTMFVIEQEAVKSVDTVLNISKLKK